MYKTALITGGTRGIGRAIVEKFASEGFDIITCARKAEEGQKLIRDFETTYPERNLHFYACDLAVQDQLNDFLLFVKALAHPVYVLVNNTGYYTPGAILTEQEGTLEGMMQANLYSAYYMSRGIVPMMVQAGFGHVFNICSIASIMAYANGGSYSITKFAMLGMSKVLREETKSTGVKVTSVLPGAVLTSSWDGVDLPAERFIQPKDIADSIWACFALSKSAVVEELLIRPQLGDL
jgi:short-subunit dehydrogenase